jgi:hypothetical protein
MEMITTQHRRFHAFLIENRSAVKTGMGNLLAESPVTNENYNLNRFVLKIQKAKK